MKITGGHLTVGGARKYPPYAGDVKAVVAGDPQCGVATSPRIRGYHNTRDAEVLRVVGLRLGRATAGLPGVDHG